MSEVDDGIFQCIVRIARDCVPDRRLRILGHVLQGNSKLKSLTKLLPYALVIIERDLQELKYLKIPFNKDNILAQEIIKLEKSWIGWIVNLSFQFK